MPFLVVDAMLSSQAFRNKIDPSRLYLKINPFVIVPGQDCKVIDQHSYLIRSWFDT